MATRKNNVLVYNFHDDWFSFFQDAAMIERTQILARLRAGLQRSPVVTLVGPRQSGKTTLARQLLNPSSVNYFDLEQPRDLVRLETPMLALEPLTGLVVIDEVQRRPDLFPILRVLADRANTPARFLILGSAAPRLLKQSSESLAGRQERLYLGGFSLEEVGLERERLHWLRGGFPRSFIAETEADSWVWRDNYLQDLLIHDLPDWGLTLPASTLLRFWTLVAHYHGGIWNTSEAARLLGMNAQTIRRYLDIMTDLFLIRQLQPWQANIKKRQVKSPKVYVRDSGLLHLLLGVRSERDLLTHPKVGSSWEGYAIEAILRAAEPPESFFWSTHQDAELDLLVIKDGRRIGVECKFVDAPRLTPSLRIALQDLELDRIMVAYPGTTRYPLADRIEAVPLSLLSL